VNTRLEKDTTPPLNCVSWIHKARPGVRPVREARLAPLAAPPSRPADAIATRVTVLDDARKKRQLRETPVAETCEILNTGNSFAIMTIAVF